MGISAEEQKLQEEILEILGLKWDIAVYSCTHLLVALKYTKQILTEIKE
jgi:hypothetical protein